MGKGLTEATKEDIRQAARNLTGSGVPEDALAGMLADHAIGLLENQRAEWFVEPERTPTAVLQAMWHAYSKAALDAEVAYFSIVNDDVQAHLAAEYRDEMADAADAIRGELSAMLAGNHTRFDWPQWIHADYEARLRGDRSMDAGPKETP